MLRTGDRVGDWLVDAPLGEGGMGTVYRAHSALSDRVPAALKVLKEGDGAPPEARKQFVREAEALAALRHPAIVRVLGITEDTRRGLLGLLMELALGETLRERIHRGPMGVAEALGVFTPLASALAHAHQAGVAHRDVKPSNVILCADGPRLVDFGIATPVDIGALTHGGHMGTLAYLPPEVFRDEPVDPAPADVYALGVVMQEALTGTRVFAVSGTAETAAAVISERKREQAPLDPGPEFPEALRAVVRSATDPDPRQRPRMAGVHEALVRLVERRGALTPGGERLRPLVGPAPATDAGDQVLEPPTLYVAEPVSHPRGTLPRAAGAVVLAALALAAAAWLGFRAHGPEPEEPRPRSTRAVRSARENERSPAPAPSPSPSPRASATPSPSAPPPDAPTPEPTPPPAVVPEGPDVTGNWVLDNVVQETSVPQFRGLRLTYHLRLRQQGTRVTGRGMKVSEDGAVADLTPIEVEGVVEGRVMDLVFAEHGAMRTSHGRFRWRVSGDGGALLGDFRSDAADSAGPSRGHRED